MWTRIAAHARLAPDHPAIIADDGTLTYGALSRAVAEGARWLAARLPPGARVALALDNRRELAVLLHAVPLAGLVAVPLDHATSARRLALVRADCDPSLLFATRASAARLASGANGLEVVIVDAVDAPRWLTGRGEPNPPAPSVPSPGDVAAILYTTGTTGAPKGVTLEHRALDAAVAILDRVMGIGAWAIEATPLPLCHSFGFGRLRAVLAAGGTLVLARGLTAPARLLDAMRTHGANGLSSVPAGLAILLDHYREPFTMALRALRYLEIGSAAMRPSHLRTLVELCPDARIYVHYGLTEASRSAFLELPADLDALGSAGRPSPTVEIAVGSPHAPVTTGCVGAIHVRSPAVMREYWGRPEETQAALVDGWLDTGDLGRLDPAGRLYLAGRASEVVNVGGLKVVPLEVEAVLDELPGVRESAVVGVEAPDSPALVRLVAHLVCDPALPFSDDVARAFCLERLEPWKVPVEFVRRDALPKSASGKVLRRALRGPEDTGDG